ncbi:MAG: DUF2587 domain-containing protein [Acidimicrobiaceae bacterium]|nr:DUF2587 domain-containing protein [Acidimicrobiaceae bacterium]
MAQEGDSPGDIGHIEEPAKVVRVATMVSALLEELRRSHLDNMSREQIQLIYASALTELSGGLSDDLRSELERMRPSLPEAPASEAQLRIAHAQLVGWLEGLLNGLQAAVAAKQLTNQARVEQLQNEQQPSPSQQPGAAGPNASYL